MQLHWLLIWLAMLGYVNAEAFARAVSSKADLHRSAKSAVHEKDDSDEITELDEGSKSDVDVDASSVADDSQEDDTDTANVALDPSDIAELAETAPEPEKPPTMKTSSSMTSLSSEGAKSTSAGHALFGNLERLPPTGNKELDDLENSILNLAASGYASQDMMDFVAEIQAILTDKMTASIMQTYRNTNATLQQDCNRLNGCSSSYDTKAGNLTKDAYSMEAKKSYHQVCRRHQYEASQNWQLCQLKATAQNRLNQQYCILFNSNMSLSWPDDSQCVFQQRSYPDPATKIIDFYYDQRDFFAAWRDIFTYAWWRCYSTQCDPVKRTYAPDASITKSLKRMNLTYPLPGFNFTVDNCLGDPCPNPNDIGAICDQAQDAMDGAGCNLTTSWLQLCGPQGDYTMCYQNAQQTYLKDWNNSVSALQTQLQGQMRAIIRMQCYLGVFNLTNVSAGIVACRTASAPTDPNVTCQNVSHFYFPNVKYLNCTHPNVTYLTFYPCTYKTTIGCPADPRPVNDPNTTDYKGYYYQNCYNLQGQCRQSCCAGGYQQATVVSMASNFQFMA